MIARLNRIVANLKAQRRVELVNDNDAARACQCLSDPVLDGGAYICPECGQHYCECGNAIAIGRVLCNDCLDVVAARIRAS